MDATYLLQVGWHYWDALMKIVLTISKQVLRVGTLNDA
jgi:hypothetical protein